MTTAFDQALLSSAVLPALAHSNLVVNGFHNISQEFGDTATAVAGSFPTDQNILAPPAAAGTITAQRVASPFPTMKSIPYGLKLTVTTAGTIGTNDGLSINQRIEGTRLAKFVDGSSIAIGTTVAFVARPTADLVAYFKYSLGAGAGGRNIVKRVPLLANTDNFFTVYVPPDAVANNLANNNLQQGNAIISFGAGSSTIGAADAWASANTPLNGGSDISNFYGMAGASVVVSGLVVLPGYVPITKAILPLLARSADDELRLCQRYWQKTCPVAELPFSATDNGALTWVHPVNMSNSRTVWNFAAEMRAAPTVTFWSAQKGVQSKMINYSAGTNVSGLAEVANPRNVIFTMNDINNAGTGSVIGVQGIANARM